MGFLSGLFGGGSGSYDPNDVKRRQWSGFRFQDMTQDQKDALDARYKADYQKKLGNAPATGGPDPNTTTTGKKKSRLFDQIVKGIQDGKQ